MKRKDRARLDREFSAEIRSMGFCERCGRSSGVQLQCAHIFSRRYLRLRWMKENAICLCAGCHFWAHHNPVSFTLWVQEYFGPERFNSLLCERNNLEKPAAAIKEENHGRKIRR